MWDSPNIYVKPISHLNQYASADAGSVKISLDDLRNTE